MKSQGSESGSGGVVQPVFDKLGTLINEDIVKKIGAVYAFDIKGDSKVGSHFTVWTLKDF